MQALQDNPEWIRPVSCFTKAMALAGNNKPEGNVADWSSICRASATKQAGKICATATPEQPLFKCTYKSLSTFWQVSSSKP
jgi:hypothetical protein